MIQKSKEEDEKAKHEAFKHNLYRRAFEQNVWKPRYEADLQKLGPDGQDSEKL